MKKFLLVTLLIFVTGYSFSASHFNPARNAGTQTNNSHINELRREVESLQSRATNDENIYDATRDPNYRLSAHPNTTPMLVQLSDNTNDFYFFGLKIGINAFHLKYLGLFIAAIISAANDDDENSFRDEMKKYGKPYTYPFQIGFRGAYFYKGRFGCVLDVEYNSFEFDAGFGAVQFKSLQYFSFSLIPSILLKRLLSLGLGIYTNFLVTSGNNLQFNLDAVKTYVKSFDCGLVLSFQIYGGSKLKFFGGMDFKIGFRDRRKILYQNSSNNVTIGFFMNAGIGF